MQELTAAIYVRQSLDRGGEGAAVERQLEDCQELAAARGWTVSEVIRDNDVSASDGKQRPGYARLLGLVRAHGVDRVVVWHVDRLVRRIVDLEEIVTLCESSGVRLATVHGDLDLSTDAGRLVARILAAVARGEVERKSARQRRANEQRAKAGQMPWTRRPYGYERRNGQIVTVPEEVEALRAAAERILAGDTLAAAVRELDTRESVTTVGKPWNVTSLRRALLNPRYSGRVMYRGADVTAGQWPVVLDVATQEKLADMLRDPKRRLQQGTTLKYLLSGYVKCGRCGHVMFATTAGNATGKRWPIYHCFKCYIARRRDLVDGLVEAVILGRLQQPDAADLFTNDQDIAELRAKAGELRRRRDDLAGLLADGLLTATAVRAQTERLRNELEELEQRIAQGAADDPAVALVTAEDVRTAWEALTMRQRRRVVEVLAEITILPAARRGAPFRPEDIVINWRRP